LSSKLLAITRIEFARTSHSRQIVLQ